MTKPFLFFLFLLPSCTSFLPPPPKVTVRVQRPPPAASPEQLLQESPTQPQLRTENIEKMMEESLVKDMEGSLALRKQHEQELDAAYDCFTQHDKTISASPQLTGLMDHFISLRLQVLRQSLKWDRAYQKVLDTQTTVSLALRSENTALLRIAYTLYNKDQAAVVQCWAAYVNTVQAAKEAAAALQQSLRPPVSPVQVSHPIKRSQP